MVIYSMIICAGSPLLMAAVLFAAWYLGPRLEYTRLMLSPVAVANAQHQAALRRYELARQELGLEARVAEIERVRAETDKLRTVVRLAEGESAFTVEGNFYYAPKESRLIEASPQQIAEPPLHIRKVFSQVVQVYGIIGGQQVGKTFQTRHIISDWQRNGVVTWVIGPKWDRGEWENCRLFGGGGNYKAVAQGLDALHAEAKRRHADKTLTHKQHSPLVAVLDDWTQIVEQCDNAKSFIYQATTLFASVNIVLIFLVHADTADAWGVSKKGAALTHGFIKAYLIPHYNNSTGQINRTQTTAEVWLPGTTERRPLQLESAPVLWPVTVPPATDTCSDTVPMLFPHLAERYTGRDLEIALAIKKGLTKTATREQVRGRAADIGQRYDEIKTELEAMEAEDKIRLTAKGFEEKPPASE